MWRRRMHNQRPGRTWRSLQDTADAAVFLYDAGLDWSNWRRGVDFYQEGELLWLDVDTTIRRVTKDQKSINDFCRAFYGGPGGEPELKTYTFQELVSALNAIAPTIGPAICANGWTRSRPIPLWNRLKIAGGKSPTTSSPMSISSSRMRCGSGRTWSCPSE